MSGGIGGLDMIHNLRHGSDREGSPDRAVSGRIMVHCGGFVRPAFEGTALLTTPKK